MTFFDTTSGHFHPRQSGHYGYPTGSQDPRKPNKILLFLKKIYRLERKNITAIDSTVPSVDNYTNIKNTMGLLDKRHQADNKAFRADWDFGLFPDGLVKSNPSKISQKEDLNEIWNTIGSDLRKALKETKSK